jgi:hypothetical protein
MGRVLLSLGNRLWAIPFEEKVDLHFYLKGYECHHVTELNPSLKDVSSGENYSVIKRDLLAIHSPRWERLK